MRVRLVGHPHRNDTVLSPSRQSATSTLPNRPHGHQEINSLHVRSRDGSLESDGLR